MCLPNCLTLKNHMSGVQNPGWLFDIGDEILPNYMGVIRSRYKDPYKPISIVRDPTVRLGSFGFKKVKREPPSSSCRVGSRFKKRFGSMSAIRVLPERNSNLGHSLPKHSFLELLSRSG